MFGDSGGGDELHKKEEGLLGIALDPNFDTNHYIYLHYTPYTKVDFVNHIGTRRVARFTFNEATGKLDLASEKPIIEWTYQNHSCCHMGGDMGFDKDGNLYVLTGDTNSSGNAGGYSGNFVAAAVPAPADPTTRTRASASTTPAAPRATRTTSTARSCGSSRWPTRA